MDKMIPYPPQIVPNSGVSHVLGLMLNCQDSASCNGNLNQNGGLDWGFKHGVDRLRQKRAVYTRRMFFYVRKDNFVQACE